MLLCCPEPSTHEAAPNTLNARLFLDYNDVLNSEDADALTEFMTNVDCIDELSHIHLLSFAPSQWRKEQILRELAEANIDDVFDTITFTEFREQGEQGRHGNAKPMKIRYGQLSKHEVEISEFPEGCIQPRINDLCYEVWPGGKDTYIKRFANSSRILFADDKIKTILAVIAEPPHVQGFEVRRHKFKSCHPQIIKVNSLHCLRRQIKRLLATTTDP